MECNKDEALRVKEISEAKLVEKDFVAAKKLAQKAEKLFSGLEGLSQLLITLDVYISSEKKINGESDWYGILGVEPIADDETIRKNYRKLALTLHPDKNKSAGAEGAFKLVSEAWTLLSDKLKRKVYDQKRNPKPMYQKTVTETQKTSASTTTHQPTQPVPRPPNANTFWTKCTRCLMHFEYSKVYLNQKILCPNCRVPFWAVALPAPPINRHTKMRYHQKQNHDANHQVNNAQQGPSVSSPSVNNHVNVQQGPSLSTAAVNGGGQFKRRHEVKAGATRYPTLNSGLGSVKGDGIAKRRRVAEQPSTLPAKANPGGEKVNVSVHSKLNNRTRELFHAEVRTMLMTKARKEIHKKMDEWAAEKAARKEARKRENEMIRRAKKDAEEIIVNGAKKDVKAPSKDAINTVHVDMDDSDAKNVDMDSEVKHVEPVLMTVPDPDFHDFDMDRTERSFGENEVWAAYDEDDGMPRYYAMIHSVISKNPFKVRISWLNSKSNAELAPINWVASGFPKTSGDFRPGKHEINASLNSFSHKVQWTKGKKGVIHIYPRKGEVWALYRNWSPNWNEFTPDITIHEYDMVVVVEDYNEEKGVVVVAPLVKVAGFKSVFHQHADVAEARTIPREDIFRLSHQVPFYMLTGEESRNIPKGCLELDPAALPLELLQPTTEAKAKAAEDGQGSKRNEVKGIITYVRKMRKDVKLKGKEIDATNKVSDSR